jgi:hypothetical protein
VASPGGRRVPAGGVDSTEVREWANAQGVEVKDRGRVPADLVARFKAATLKQPRGTAQSRDCGALLTWPMCARSDGS